MSAFSLKIVSPDGVKFSGQVQQLTVRTTTGDMGVLAGHIDCVAALGMGRATVVSDGQTRYAACIGGMISVANGEVTVTPTTFEWSEDIDVSRVEKSEARAQRILENKESSDMDIRLAEARLRRALVRKSVAGRKD